MFDCRPFDPDKHFLKFSDLKQKFKFGKEKSIAPRKSEQKVTKQVYLYVKANGTWSKVGKFDKESNLLKKTVEQLYRDGAIEEHVVTGSPNDERKLNLGEKITKPIIREAKRAKKHFVETAPKALGAYQKRIGLGETVGEAKSELRRRIGEGLEIGPRSPREKRSIRTAPEIEIEEPEPMEMEIEEPEPIEMKELPTQEREIEIEPSVGMTREIQAPRRGMPPYSKGWAGSIGGSRPYRPLKYKPTGKIWKPERVHNPNPKIPMASLFQFKPPERYYDLSPKMPVTTFKFMR